MWFSTCNLLHLRTVKLWLGSEYVTKKTVQINVYHSDYLLWTFIKTLFERLEILFTRIRDTKTTEVQYLKKQFFTVSLFQLLSS